MKIVVTLGFKSIRNYKDNPNSHQNKTKLLMAKVHSKSGNPSAALDSISELSNSDVGLDAKLLNAEILIKSNDSLSALSILNELSEQHPFQWNIHASKCDAFQQYLNLHPTENETCKRTISNALMMRGDWDAAIQTLQKSDSEKDDQTTQQMIARCFFEQSRYDLANQIYHRLTKETKNKSSIKSILYQSGLCHLLQSNEEDALVAFESVSTYDHAFLNTQSIIESLRKQKFLNHNGLVIVGTIGHDQPHYVIRKNHFGPQKKQTHQFEVIGFSQSYNDEGCKQYLKQQFKAAKESFELAIQMDPKFHIPYINLSMIYLHQNNIKLANETIQKAEAITTNCPYTNFVKGLCEIKRNETELALRSIQNAIKLYGNESIFHIVMGDLFYQKFQLELANSYWNKASQFMDIAHIQQSRLRINHFDKISIDYWASPELLFLK